MDARASTSRSSASTPSWYRTERDVAKAACDLQNERLAELCATYPDRFLGYAFGAADPDIAVQQLEHGIEAASASRESRSVASVAGQEFADPKFHPVWAKAEELGAVVFIHPQTHLSPRQPLQGPGPGSPTPSATRSTPGFALSHLIFEGTLDKFPGLRSRL